MTNTRAELVQQAVELLSRANQILDEIGEKMPERWEPSGEDWFISASGEVFPVSESLPAWRLAGVTSRTPEQSVSKAKERIARELLQEWVYENGESGDWVVVQDLSGRWLSLNRPEYCPGMVKMDRETVERAKEALNNGTLVLEVRDD